MKKLFLSLFILVKLITAPVYGQSCTIILDPGSTSGTKAPLSHKLTTMFQQKLYTALPTTRIIITKKAQERLEQLEIAALANKLHATLFIHCSVSIEPDAQPAINLYSFAYNPVTDLWQNNNRPFAFIPLSQVHYPHAKRSQQLTKTITNLLKESGNYSALTSIIAPFKPLRGIDAPAFGIELILTKPDDWHDLLDPLIKAISTVITQEFLNEA